MRFFCGILLLSVISLHSASLQVGSSTNGEKESPQPAPVVLNSGENWGVSIKKVPPLAFPDGRLLVTAGDTIYMVASGGQVLWSYSAEVPLTAEPAYRADRNEIAIVGLDLTYQWLDAETGKVRWRGRVSGSRAVYIDVKPFDAGYLVLVDLSAYDNDNARADYMGRPRGNEPRSSPDRLRYWVENEDDSWSVDFPAGAALAVAGEHIYGVKYEENKVTLQEIRPSSRKK